MPLKLPEKSVSLKSPISPTSQIPGLCDLAKAPHEMLSGCCRKWIKETGLACIRLAKQGGPDLLKHYTPVTSRSSPPAYAASRWYSHGSSPPATNEPCVFQNNSELCFSLPDYMIHREANDHHGNSYELRGPFDLDIKSVWQRDAEEKEKTERKKIFLTQVKLPAIKPKYPSRMPTVSTNKDFSGKNKLSFPPMPAQKKTEAVNFSKLISSGYGPDWFQQCTGWEKKIQETSENS
ncbi:LOW QUALITY PROTEIN: uncharacterized protein C7orf57 homolog [Morus bassanus]